MFNKIIHLGIGLVVAVVYAQTCRAITVTSTADPGGKTASQLAIQIADGIDVAVAGAAPVITGDPLAIGHFSAGITTAGTLITPSDNQNPAGNAVYSGGIGILNGVCLCTGLLNDAEVTSPAGRGVGVQGPNNGDPIDVMTIGGTLMVNEGEISRDLNQTTPDPDFEMEVFPGGSSMGGDAVVLEFEVATTLPGWLRVSFVIASDEFPFWVTIPDQDINDSLVIFVDDVNIVRVKKEELGATVEGPLTLKDLIDCGSPIFKQNQIAPAPADMFPTQHEIAGATNYYDHEFAGFSEPLTFETKCALDPGTHTVKIVIQDVADRLVDSGVFIEEHSMKLFAYTAGDLNMDGFVDGLDLGILLANFNQNSDYFGGELNGTNPVDGLDLGILLGNWGTGNQNFCADFNRDGTVNAADFLIWQKHVGLTQCGSRSTGDANNDGKVDSADLAIYDAEKNSGEPSGLCDGCNTEHITGAGGGSSASLAPPAGGLYVVQQEPDLADQADGFRQQPNAAPPVAELTGFDPLDIDFDGDVDLDDGNLWLERLTAGE